VCFQKIFNTTPNRVIGNSTGESLKGLQSPILKEKYYPKLEFPQGLNRWGDSNKKKMCWRGVDLIDIFWNNAFQLEQKVKSLRVSSFGVTWSRISDPRSPRSWCIKGTDKFTLVMDSSVPSDEP